MNKIPFEATFTGAYKFLYRRIFSIIGTVWLPTLVFGLIVAGLLYLTIPHGWWSGHFPVFDDKHPNPEAVLNQMLPALKAYVPIMLALMAMSAMITVGLMRLALGQKTRCFIFFSLGGDFWRMIGNSALAFLVLMLLFILMIAGLIFGSIFLGPLLGKGWGAFAFVVALIGGMVFWVYSIIRLTFFLPAVAVAEHQVNLGRSWELAAGSFWRIVGISLLVTIPPATVAQVVQQIVIASPLFTDVVGLIGKTHDIAVIFHAALPLLGAFLGVLFLQNTAAYALMAAAAAKAYLAVTGTDEVAP